MVANLKKWAICKHQCHSQRIEWCFQSAYDVSNFFSGDKLTVEIKRAWKSLWKVYSLWILVGGSVGERGWGLQPASLHCVLTTSSPALPPRPSLPLVTKGETQAGLPSFLVANTVKKRRPLKEIWCRHIKCEDVFSFPFLRSFQGPCRGTWF